MSRLYISELGNHGDGVDVASTSNLQVRAMNPRAEECFWRAYQLEEAAAAATGSHRLELAQMARQWRQLAKQWENLESGWPPPNSYPARVESS